MVLAIEASPEQVGPLLHTAWATFAPRPDRPADFDQQRSYVEAKDLVSFCCGGNASGKTASSAKKCANFVLTKEPPRPDTPFWIIGQTYKQVCAVCWAEKLWGQQFIPRCQIDTARIKWVSERMGWPASVPLKKRPNGNNWTLEFMSYEQGRMAMQARSIGGFWFSEQFPWPLFLEVLRGCRDYMFPGGQFCEFTPIDPELCIAIEKIMADPPPGWAFYRLNTECNKQNLAPDWYDQFFAAVPDEMQATRKTGALATFEGVIYTSFNPLVHVTDDDGAVWRSGMTHHRAFDWGASIEHPFAGVWGCYDGMGDWLIYDEYWDISQDKITQDHAADIVARSIAWGWPRPEMFKQPDRRQRQFIKEVNARLRELRVNGVMPTEGSIYADSFADPSRPGEMNAFNYWGISTMPAANDVLKGIDCVRSKLKANPTTGRPALRIHRRCKHLIEELRKYRWLKRKIISGFTAAPRVTPLKKDDDVADSARYLLYSIDRTRGLAPGSTTSRPDDYRRSDVLYAQHRDLTMAHGYFRR